MASAVPQKRMVSSVFITLSSPHRATVTQQQQQQPALHTQSGSAADRQHTTARVCPAGDNLSALRHKTEDQSPSNAHGFGNSRNWTHVGPPAKGSDPQSQPQAAQTGPTKVEVQEKHRSSSEIFPPPPPPPASDMLPLSLSEDSALPPPPSSLTSSLHPQSPDHRPVSNKEAETFSPSRGLKHDEKTNGIHRNSQDMTTESKDLCGFCRKPMALSEPAIEALNRIYHEGCFQCRSCHIPLAGKQYYNKAGIPLCEGCYQASLELCWTCGEVITDQIIRAIERTYHPSCFTCTTCKQQIGAQAFAQGEVGEVYCLQDYYSKYAPKCSACDQLIIPKEDGTDSYTVECLGHPYHENCYRCEVCGIQLSPEPNEHGCHPLEGKMLCKACHMNLVSRQQ